MEFKRVVRQPRGPPLEGEGKNWTSEVIMNDSSVDLNDNFVKMQNGQRRHSRSSISSAYGAESPSPENQNFPGFEDDDIFSPSEELVYVTYVESPSFFWAQIADAETEEKVKLLTEKLQVFCGNRPLLQSSPILRKIYGGIYTGDNQWYRCKILENIGNTEVKVHFVDFGNTEVISQREVVCLSHELYSHPPYAKQYKLNGVNDPKDPNSKLFIKGVEHLSNLVADKNLFAKKNGSYKSPTNACFVDLVYINGNQVTDINQEMIKGGFSAECREILEEKPSTPNYVNKPEATTNKTPITSNTRVISSSDYTPLRKPVNNNVQEEKMQELEETIKSQSKTIDTLKQMCRQLEQSRKLELEDKERKFKEQLVQVNDQLNHAVSTKVTQLLFKVHHLRKIRKDSKDNGRSALSAIHDTILLLQEQNTIELDKMEELNKVQEVESLHDSLQDKIRHCTDKDLLPGLVEERNKARQDLNEAINIFINCVQAMQLDLFKVKLQVAQTSLVLYIGNSSDCTKVSVNTPSMEVVKEYEECMAKKEENLKEMHTLVNQKCKNLGDVHNHIIRLLNLDEELDSVDYHSVADLDDMMGVLEALIQEEVAKSKCSEAEAALRGKAVAALMVEINKQLECVQELRDTLLERYISLQTKIQDSLRIKPDIDNALVNKKTIRKLTTQLRYKQVDEVEMKETEDATEEDMTKLREELSHLYNELHGAFAEEDTIINNLANLTKEHFPELLLQYPKLGIDLCLATNGLVKSGRAVEQYPLEELYAGVFSSLFCEKKCLIKEYFFRDASSKDLFQSKAVEFHDCTCEQLIELQAVFYNKNGRIGYLQVPYYDTTQEWLKTAPQTEARKRVMKDILEGLQALHSSDVVHGSISNNCVFISRDDNGQARGVLGPYDFAEKLDSRVLLTAKKLGFSENIAKCTPKFDMMCFGQLLASLILPGWTLSSSLSDLSLLTEDAELKSLLKGLLSDEDTLTASQALTLCYFKESIVQDGHISPVDEELD